MTRTQVYLSDEELELLDQARDATGASRSELIRRAVRATFGQPSKRDRLRALERSAGSWPQSAPSGARYVREIRGDLNQRLRSLGLE